MIDDNQGSQKQYQGAQWVRVDFHLHSPGAFSFRFPNGVNPERDRDRIVNQFVQQLANQDIRIAAITDYQGIRIDWFTPIRDAARKHGIVVYPGAELSFDAASAGKRGLHIIAIFPYDADPEKINLAIQNILDDKPLQPLIGEDGQHRDLRTKDPLNNSLTRFRKETDALLIVAHPNDTKGLFTSFDAKGQAEFIASVIPDAIESITDNDQRRLANTALISREKLDRIASVESTDNHSIEEIGAKYQTNGVLRATYLKLSVLDDLRAIRLALHDPQILVRTGEKPSMRYTHFERLEVDGSGFLGGLSLALSPELNVFVGGRGVGKSAILETIRYILGLPLYSPTEYREGLVQFALGSGGKAILYVEQYVNPNVRRRYRIERVWGETPRIVELEPEREVLLTPSEILGDQESPLYFGQREIYEVTRNEPQRLRLLDEIIGKQARTQLLQVQKLETRLRENARAILEKRRKLTEREEIEQRLNEIKHKIELYRRYGLTDKLHQATSLAADEQRLTQAQSGVSNAVTEWREAGEYWISRWGSSRDDLKDAESDQKALLGEADNILANLQQQIKELFTEGEAHLLTASQALQVLFMRWQETRKPLNDAIRQVKQELGEQSLDPDELIRLTSEQTLLEPQLRTLKKIQGEVDQLEKDRRKLLKELREARREAWKLRDKQAKLISEKLRDRVNVQVEYRGQRNGFIDELVNFFRGSGIDRKSLERIASSNVVMDGIEIADKAREGANALESVFGLTTSRAQQMHTYLTEDESKLFDLQLLAPDDAVQVSLRINETYHPLRKLSDGQRATAMLLLLLVQEERLLIVDQPEDDLDNRFVYEDIVRILREQKGKRQLVVATHNPNIPVLGHAELIVALEAQEDHCIIAAQGAIDQRSIQEFVRNVMEGGEEAFQRRAQKYGWG